MVIINKKDYVSKMESILNDQSKFCRLGPAPDNESTVKIESKIQRRLLQMHKDDLLPTGVYEVIRPTGSQRPRMYGLPKIHKKDVPFRPILSMTGSAQHQLGTWLTSVLQLHFLLLMLFVLPIYNLLPRSCALLIYPVFSPMYL